MILKLIQLLYNILFINKPNIAQLLRIKLMQVNQVKVFYRHILKVHMKYSSQTNFLCKTYKGISLFQTQLNMIIQLQEMYNKIHYTMAT